jgi:hypothetical protein
VSSVGTTNQNYQLAFRAKAGDRKMVHEFIDKSNDLAMDFINKDRPLAEKREVAMRRFLSKFKIKDLFVGKKVKPKETTIEHINTAVETANNASRAVYLEQLRKTDPELYKEVLRRDAILKVAQMSNTEIIKEFINGLFKKH